jgi:putative redox protein
MTLISPELRLRFETLRQTITASGSTNALAKNKAEVRLIKDQHSEAKVRGFTVVQDEPESIGGTGKGPTPTDYLTASIGFCENVIFVRNASLAGLSLDSLETIVTGSWDRRGLFEIDNVSPYFNSITVETRVSTKDSVDRVVAVANETHRRCPVHATLARATEIIFKLIVNGENVPL